MQITSESQKDLLTSYGHKWLLPLNVFIWEGNIFYLCENVPAMGRIGEELEKITSQPEKQWCHEESMLINVFVLIKGYN